MKRLKQTALVLKKEWMQHCKLTLITAKLLLKGVIEHFRKVLAIGPAIVYNVPARTGQDITPDIVEAFADHENFVGMKECSGNDRICYYENKGIACWSGNDDESFVARHQCDSHGVISVTSNLLPSLMRKLMDNAENEQLNQELQETIACLFWRA